MNTLQVFAGQSEMITFGLTVADLPPALQVADPHIQILVGDHFETMVPGVNTGGPNTPNAVGPMISETHDWVAAHPGDTLYVVLSAKGSTGLTAGVAPNWSPEQPANPDGSPNGMFNKTTALVNTAKALTGLQVHDVFWSEGETPATDATAAATFQHETQDVFAHMRSDWGADQIVFSQISGRTGFAYGDEVRAAQQAIAQADPHSLLINTDALTLQADNLHITDASAVGLGDAYFVGGEVLHLMNAVGVSLFGGLVAEL
jgi:hypothetical protein